MVSFFPSIFFLFLSCTLQNVLQKLWTGGQALRILKILMTTVHISLFKSVDMWTRSCFCVSCFLSFLYPLNFWKKVWTGGQVLNFLKKNQLHVHISFFKSVECGQEAIFPFHVFFLSCTLSYFFKNCGQVDKLWIFWKKIYPMYVIITKCRHVDNKLSFYFMFSFFLVPFKIFAKSVDMWTRSCLSISCFFFFLSPLKSCQKVWTSGQVDK